MKTNANEPINCNNGNGYWSDEMNKTHGGVGLTKREYFAAMAMQGLEASNFLSETQDVLKVSGIVLRAVKLADALIEELNKGGEGEE